MEVTKKDDLLSKIIKITHVPPQYRTIDETTIYMNFLAEFDIFKTKVLDDSLHDVLNLATKHLRYSKVPAGQFLYHLGQPSNCIYLIVKGEAWKFRPKTDYEYEWDHLLKQKKTNTKDIPKIMETISLAKALADRNRVPNSAQLNNKPMTAVTQNRNSIQAEQTRSPRRRQIVKDQGAEVKSPDLPKNTKEEENRIENDSPRANKNIKLARADTKKFNFSILQRLKDTKDVLNFENDYLMGLIKRNEQLSSKYLKDKVPLLKFEKKFGEYETLGEMSMSLNQTRTSTVLAYTDLHFFYLDQKSYEKVFFAQIEEVKEKLNFFSEYFKDINFNTIKRICFLFSEKKFKLGDIIYKEGSSCDNLYFIKSGEIHLEKNLALEESSTPSQSEIKDGLTLFTPFHRKQPKNVLIASVSEGHFFGEEVITDQQTRNFTAKSTSNLLCYVVTPQVLSRLPEKIISKLQEISNFKQNWRGERLENIKNQPLYRHSQKNLSFSSARRAHNDKSLSIDTDNSSIDKSDRSNSQESSSNKGRFVTPKKKIDLTCTEYGFTYNKKSANKLQLPDQIKTDDEQYQPKLPTSINNLEKKDNSFDRKSLFSRTGKTVQRIGDQNIPRFSTPLKASFYPNSARNRRVVSPRSFEARIMTENEENNKNTNSSSGVLLSESNAEGNFEYNFVIKRSNNKKSASGSKNPENVSKDKTNNANLTKKVTEAQSPSNNIISPKNQTFSQANFLKLKESFISMMNQKANIPSQRRNPEKEIGNYLNIASYNVPDNIKHYTEELRPQTAKDELSPIVKFERSVGTPKDQKVGFVLNHKFPLFRVHGNKLKGLI